MLDQTEQVGACTRQWASHVILRQALQLADDGLTHPPQILKEVLLREVIDHAVNHDSNRRGQRQMWKGLIMLTNKLPGQAEFARHVLDELFAEA